MSNEERVQVSQDNGVVRIRLNRPEKKNAFTQAMYTTCNEALKAADNDASVHAVLFESSGDSFSAGNDLNDFLAVENLDESAPPFQFLHTLAQVEVPIVAAVNGLAIGIGTTLLLHCDLVYSSDDAVFALPFVQLGLLPEAASSLLLPQICGYQKAAELLLLGENFDAQTAQQAGFVNHVVSVERLPIVVSEALDKLRKQSGKSLRISKHLLKQPAESVADRISREATFFAKALNSDAARQAIAAKLQKK
ncbi:enoyl-CoA hydratase [Idiomarina aminovorans]|uniref:enoyl-CoA hydratase n=1 Tax=Idiomarina aminovorans TaxID=2914829 RepID=UPI002004134F|nr:enoyl-CoA hydratase [Idiomarina sp. ATCH4]MCK7460437.1 enoyl-CoA hydratase [Idiomarina sp. ATCH4]